MTTKPIRASETATFCANCSALLINVKECPECAPYQRLLASTKGEIEMMLARENDAIRILESLKIKRMKAISFSTKNN
jgi:hypothetical protein